MDVYAAARKMSALTLDPAIASLPAKPPSHDIQYQHARNLLLKAFHNVHNKPPWSREPQARLVFPTSNGTIDELTCVPRYARQLSKSSNACNVSLITAAGVEFRIHSRMLVDGPKFREEWLIESDVSLHIALYRVALTLDKDVSATKPLCSRAAEGMSPNSHRPLGQLPLHRRLQ